MYAQNTIFQYVFILHFFTISINIHHLNNERKQRTLTVMH